MRRPASVLTTQEPVLDLQRAIFKTEQRLGRMIARLEKAIEAHREQIRRSLESCGPAERQMAEGVADLYEVRPHPAEA